MSWTLRIAAATLLLAVSMGASACSSAPPAEPDAAQAPSSTTPNESLDRAVRADADQIMVDIENAPASPLSSSDPSKYIGVSPAFKLLVARGEPAVESIAREIERSGNNGLREYLLASAASEILKQPDSEKRWSTAEEWVAQYRSGK